MLYSGSNVDKGLRFNRIDKGEIVNNASGEFRINVKGIKKSSSHRIPEWRTW